MINYDNSNDSKQEDILLIETILSSFIPFYNQVISAKMNNQEERVESLNNIIVMIDGMNIQLEYISLWIKKMLWIIKRSGDKPCNISEENKE